MMKQRAPRAATAPRQHGVVLLYTLIALVIMMIAGIALVRSFNASLFNAGNLAFKRDLVNQSERARALVWTALSTGGLSTEAARNASQPTLNYSAQTLPSNAQGIPNALLQLNDSDFGTQFSAGDIVVADQGVSIRYVIDRQCLNAGPADQATCLMAGAAQTQGKDANLPNVAASPTGIVYRLSLRVTGPRDTRAFMQATFSP